MEDTPPQDSELLEALAAHEGGLTPVDLLSELSQTYPAEHVVAAIQRAFGRGIVKLAAGARLIAAEEAMAEAA